MGLVPCPLGCSPKLERLLLRLAEQWLKQSIYGCCDEKIAVDVH